MDQAMKGVHVLHAFPVDVWRPTRLVLLYTSTSSYSHGHYIRVAVSIPMPSLTVLVHSCR